jgi:hypothetical protein
MLWIVPGLTLNVCNMQELICHLWYLITNVCETYSVFTPQTKITALQTLYSIKIPVYLMKVIPETRCVPKFDIYVLIMHAISKFAQIKHKYTCGQWSFYLIKIVHSLTCHWGGGGVISHLPRSFLQYKSKCLKKVNVKYVNNRWWHEIFHIVPGISPRPLRRRRRNFSPTLLLGSCSKQCLFYYDKVSRCVCYEYH